MDKIIEQYPSLSKIKKSIPIREHYAVVIQTNLEEKQQFVKEMNELAMKNYESIFSGKKVAIIGPSPSIYNEENGDEIEEKYDIIVRINKQWRHDSKLDSFIGKRTDILYNCMNPSEECGGIIDIDYVKQHNLQLIVDPIMFGYNMQNTRDYIFRDKKRLDYYVTFHLNNQGIIPFGMIQSDKYMEWDKIANTRINTGLLAIVDILSTDAKEVYIKGFTFFKDGYINDYRNKIGGKETNEENSTEVVLSYMDKYKIHDQEKQWIFFKQFIQNEEIKSKLKMDKALTQIMDLSKFEIGKP
jgi:hypothetical protein